MQTYTDNVVDRAGNTLGGAQVTVYLSDGTTKATLPSNPITTGDNGEFSFTLPNGKYVVSVSHPLITTKTEAVYLFDPTDSTLPTADEKASFPATASGVDPLALASDARFPTTEEKAGLAGISAADPAVQSSEAVHKVATIAALRLLPVVADKAVQPLGYYAAGDGGGGPVRVGKTGAAPGTYVDNGGSIIVPTGGDGSGAWVWEHSGPVSVKWFGAKGDGVADDTAAIQAAITASNGNVDFGSSGTYLVTGPIGLPTKFITDAGSFNLVGSGAEILVASSEAIFTSERSLATPESTSNLYTSKINVTGLNFRGSGTAVVFNGDRLYNLYALNCNFVTCTSVIRSYRARLEHSDGYLQSVAFVNCHFAQNTRIVDAKVAYNFIFDGNFCENNPGGIYIDGTGDPSINTLRVVNNLFEGGGVFLKLGSVIGGVISGNYFEANTLGDVPTLKCHIHMVRTTGGFTSGCVISNNMFAATAAQMTDPDWRDIKFAPGVTNTAARPPVVHSNWSNSYQLMTENHVITAFGNGGPGGDILAQRMRVPTPHAEAGISYTRYSRSFLASEHLSGGVFNVAEISTADIKSLLVTNSAARAHTLELTLMLQNLTAGGVCVGSSVAKIQLIVQGAQGGGDVDTMFVDGSLLGIAQIPTGTVFDTLFGSDFKQHWTNPALSIVANGADNYYIRLSGYAAVNVANYGAAAQLQTSLVMQVNGSAFGDTLRGLTRLV